jgi:hypothetical protein
MKKKNGTEINLIMYFAMKTKVIKMAIKIKKKNYVIWPLLGMQL